MAYTTELMEGILDAEPVSESAKKAIQRVTHKYGEAYAVLWLFKAIGLEYDKYFQYVDELKNQVVPQTAEGWALSYWERSLGLLEDSTLNDEARRLRIINKKSQHLPMNPARLEAILTAIAGEKVTIQEHISKNRFGVWVDENNRPFSSEDVQTIRKELKRRKQCQMVFDLGYWCNSNFHPHYGNADVQQSRRIVPAGVNVYGTFRGCTYQRLKDSTYYQILSLGGKE